MTLKGQMLISFDFSLKQKDHLDIGGPSGLDYGAFSLCGSAFFSSAFMCEVRTVVHRQFAVLRPCDIFALVLCVRR